MSNKQYGRKQGSGSMNIIKFCDLPNGSTFVVLREQGRESHAAGRWVKKGNSHSQRYHGEDVIILALDDLVSPVHTN